MENQEVHPCHAQAGGTWLAALFLGAALVLIAAGAQGYVPIITTSVDGGDCSSSSRSDGVRAGGRGGGGGEPGPAVLMVDAAFTNDAGEVVTYNNVTNVTLKNREA